MRFYDAERGEIRVDGKDIRGITRKSLRKAYAMVLQDTWLFHGTVYENLAYGREGVSREEIEKAAKAAYIHSFIMQLPNGYETVLREDGANISKVQKQLLTIARAMLQDCRMLIPVSYTHLCSSRQAAIRSISSAFRPSNGIMAATVGFALVRVPVLSNTMVEVSEIASR